MTTALLSGHGLTQIAHDDGRELLHPTDFEVLPNARIAITGPSGAGKSVLLRTIALLDIPSSGSLFFQGQQVALKAQAIGQYRSEVAYVRQQPVLLPGSVRDNLAFPFTLQRYQQQKFDEHFVQEALQKLGKKADFLTRDGSDLSGGEAQLVCLLRVIQLNPSVLLLDEPTAALDETSARQVQQLVQHWQQQHATGAYLWISHNDQQCREVGDVLWLIEDGRIAKIKSHETGEQHADNTHRQ
ncbi:ATP-binding cassette domain-containing protein [Neisseriaceae bacterium ESL0693]|nr:ATP-binding cassette domain-containing protein [Neisseriaceae bacterium ESL0693]